MAQHPSDCPIREQDSGFVCIIDPFRHGPLQSDLDAGKVVRVNAFGEMPVLNREPVLRGVAEQFVMGVRPLDLVRKNVPVVGGHATGLEGQPQSLLTGPDGFLSLMSVRDVDDRPDVSDEVAVLAELRRARVHAPPIRTVSCPEAIFQDKRFMPLDRRLEFRFCRRAVVGVNRIKPPKTQGRLL